MKYSTREIDYPDDKTFITEILGKYLDFKNGANVSVEWNFENNPLHSATARLLMHEIDQVQHESVGSLSVVYRDFICNKKRYKVGLFGDFVVEPVHRALSPALKLAKDTANEILEDTPFIYGFPNDKALPVLKMSGFKVIGKLTRFAYIVRFSSYLRKTINFPFIPFLLGMVIDVIRRGFSSFMSLFSIGNSKIKEVKEFDRSIDKLTKYSVFNSLICNRRTAEYLNWRYFNNPQHDYKSLASYDKKSNHINGYLIYEIIDDTLHIIDIFAVDAPILTDLLKAAKKKALSVDCSTVSFSFMGSEEVVDILKKSAFYPRESKRNVIINANNHLLLSEFLDQANWYIVDGDEDQ